MALKSPMLPSPDRNLMSAFSPYSESPTSPAPFRSPVTHSRPVSNEHARSLHPPNQSSPLASSPSDIPDPSPIATSSNGTDTTDIDDTGIENEDLDPTQVPPEAPAPSRSTEPALKLETANAASDARKPRSDEDEQPSSVIHAPQGFDTFHRQSPPSLRRSTPTPSQASDIVIVPPPEDNAGGKKISNSPSSPPPIQTSIAPITRDWSATPRAQTRPEAETQTLEPKRPNNTSRSSSRSSNLEDIPEAIDTENNDDLTPNHHTSLFDHTVERFQETADEVAALKIALSECWTLCNTLAGLSYIHRERIFSDERSHFSFSAKGDMQEQAWKSCWKLCQKLYETRDEEIATQVRPTLDLCRDFCQCLFEVRRRDNDVADSVLRVSFELNNHLYNTHDRTLPEAFRERTLDFYITLCHRLMKQRSDLARETDSLLEACWSLAEMLFSLRQNKREGKPADEELLGSAVQACWELCDLFREGWTQIRPDRGTPRPSQTTFTQAFQQAKQSQVAASFAHVPETYYESEDEDFGRANPETPTTVFEDTVQDSPDEGPMPNILVLGPSDQNNRQQPGQHQPQWSSSSSNLSGYSQSSGRTTSSTSTIINPVDGQPNAEDTRLTCLKLLIVKAAINTGFQRSSSTTLAAFVKSVPSNSFGAQPWQSQLLHDYKKAVASDPALRSPGPVRRARAVDVARSVRWMVGSHGQYAWLKDLFRLVFGFHVEDAEGRDGVVIQS
ncbi:MAG: hypothetical protein ALECFALPRED_007068 [Alectoria fallacina]|uniref:DUF7624 domain-containing protein n=1 Tax=Alectoria fallacina TaxID=1903189 RepID=A0A8H3ETD9_9LECA|nr:MAG: hypothetical protein ALECFALPRED_007068 [Alectoria fallacina]